MVITQLSNNYQNNIFLSNNTHDLYAKKFTFCKSIKSVTNSPLQTIPEYPDIIDVKVRAARVQEAPATFTRDRQSPAISRDSDTVPEDKKSKLSEKLHNIRYKLSTLNFGNFSSLPCNSIQETRDVSNNDRLPVKQLSRQQLNEKLANIKTKLAGITPEHKSYKGYN